MVGRTGSPAAIRSFDLRLPSDPVSGLYGRVLHFETPGGLTVPNQLHRRGLAGYEPETLATFIAALEMLEPELVLDVGANVGIFTLLAASISTSQVVGFEPEPGLADTADRLARMNDLDRVRIERLALADRQGTARFFLSSKGDSSNSLVEGFRVPTGVIDVRTETLDSYVTGAPPGLIKIDVETAEVLVLAGARKVITEHRPWLIVEVLAQGGIDQVIARFFSGLDYHWFQITKENPLVSRMEVFGDRAGVYRNWLFAPEKPSDRFWELRDDARQRLAACTPIEDGAFRTPIPIPGPVVEVDGETVWMETWNPVPTSRDYEAAPLAGGRLRLEKRPGSARWYLSHGRSEFDRLPEDASAWPLTGDALYQLDWSVADLTGDLDISLVVIEYDETGRIAATWSGDDPTLEWCTLPAARTMRLALRIQGGGSAIVGPFRLFRLD